SRCGAVDRRRMARRSLLHHPDGGAVRAACRPLWSEGTLMDLLGYGAFFLTTALIFSLVTLGLNLQWGLTGLFNVGLAGFVAIGAYTSALLTTPDDAGRFGGFDMPIVVGWLAAMATAGVAAAITGVATLRL